MEHPDPYIAKLEAEKQAMEDRIAELQSEIRTINNLIYRRKSEIHAHDQDEPVTGKNIDRLLFETLILDTVRKSKRGLRTGQIYSEIKKSGYGLNYNTLRSYVTKMRNKGLIKKSTPASYYWVAIEN